jgi:biopolymer transport protein ExbB
MNTDTLYTWAGNATYATLAFTAFYGAYCALIAWMSVSKKRFKTEEAQNEFLGQVDGLISRADYNGVMAMCEDDPRALPQLIFLAVANRNIGPRKIRELVQERFQRDVLSSLEYYMTWVLTMIKTGPMWGLLGTVLGMMGAFGQLAAAETVKASALAGNISLALLTTAIGLLIAIPLMMYVSIMNLRIRQMEDFVASGTARFFETFQASMSGKSIGRAS